MKPITMVTGRLTMSFRLSPEKRDEVVSAIQGMLGLISAQPGYLGCRLCEDLTDRGTIIVASEWDTQEHLRRHFRSRAFRRLLMLSELADEKPEFRFDEIAETHGLEAVTAALRDGPKERRS